MSDRPTLRLVTRDSPLAITQSRRVAAMLAATLIDTQVELVPLKAHGDRSMAAVSAVAGQSGVGIFTKVLDDALLADAGDFAVHSFKDYPTAIPEGLTIAAVPERAAPHDVLVVPTEKIGDSDDAVEFLRALAGGGKSLIGTSSPRRHAQLLLVDATLRVAPVRGNVGTRLRKLHAGECTALIMAAAGLERLGLEQCPELEGLTLLPLLHENGPFLPAPAQGALCVTCRSEDAELREKLAKIDNAAARAAADAERAALAAMGGGCFLPMAALAVPFGDDGEPARLRLRAMIAAPPKTGDTPKYAKAEAEGPANDPLGLGQRAADQLRAEGADELLALG